MMADMMSMMTPTAPSSAPKKKSKRGGRKAAKKATRKAAKKTGRKKAAKKTRKAAKKSTRKTGRKAAKKSAARARRRPQGRQEGCSQVRPQGCQEGRAQVGSQGRQEGCPQVGEEVPQVGEEAVSLRNPPSQSCDGKTGDAMRRPFCFQGPKPARAVLCLIVLFAVSGASAPKPWSRARAEPPGVSPCVRRAATDLCDGARAALGRRERCAAAGRGVPPRRAVRTGAASLVTRSCWPSFTCSCASPFQR